MTRQRQRQRQRQRPRQTETKTDRQTDEDRQRDRRANKEQMNSKRRGNEELQWRSLFLKGFDSIAVLHTRGL